MNSGQSAASTPGVSGSVSPSRSAELEASVRAFFAQAAEEQRKYKLARKLRHEDKTQLSDGPDVQRRFNPEDRAEIRGVLLLVPSEPSLTNVLTDDELSIWKLRFDPAQYSFDEIAQQIGTVSRWTISRTIDDCVAKLRVRYLELYQSGQPVPMSLEVILRKYVRNDACEEPEQFSDEYNYKVLCRLLQLADSSMDSFAVASARKSVAEYGTRLVIRGGGRREKTFTHEGETA